jgi:hypothetical protein
MERQLTRERQATASEALRAQYDLYREMSGARKLELVFETCRTGRELALAGLKMRHPEAGDEQLWRRWAREHLGAELFEAVYGAAAR